MIQDLTITTRDILFTLLHLQTNQWLVLAHFQIDKTNALRSFRRLPLEDKDIIVLASTI